MRRRTLFGIVAGSVVTATVVAVALVWPGLDAQDVPDVDTSVWALQTGEGRRYARLNTAVGELDTVRSISNPDQIALTADSAFLFSDSLSKVTRIDEAQPVDLDEEALRESASTPAGTVSVSVAGDHVAYLTDAGAVYVGSLSAGIAARVEPFPPEEDEEEDAPQYAADAIAVDSRGMVFSFSSADSSVIQYDIGGGSVVDRDPVAADRFTVPAISAAGDRWVLIDTEDGDVLVEGADGPQSAPTTGAIAVSAPDADGASVYLADETSLVRVTPSDESIDTVTGTATAVLGTPAAPVISHGEVFAAWLGRSDTGGTLWRSDDGSSVALDYGGQSLADERRPTFVVGADAVVLNETRSGWAWTVPDGALVASSQNWLLDDRTDPDSVPSEDQLPVQLDPKPPIAESDAFGVRPGALASLPVLLNDHDPNTDVLSIDPTSVTGLDPGFGTVSIIDNGQRLAVQVDPAARGVASFSYRVSDGTAADGLLSEPATVTLTAVGAEAESAPEWCGVDRCLVPWPEPEVARGGTVTVPVLPGWVDPEGDPMLVVGVENPSSIGSVAASPTGDVVYQHDDDGNDDDQLIELVVSVADTAGAVTQRSLMVRVSGQPKLVAQPFAVVDTVANASITVDVAPHLTGTAGRLSLSSVRVLDNAAATATMVSGTTAFDFAADAAGTYRVDFTATDGSSQADGTAKITLLPADAPAQLSTAPVVAFVHPQTDSTIDVFAAVSNPTGRVLLLSDIVTVAEPGAALSVDVVAQSQLRVSGSTATGASGRLGKVSYTVSDGSEDAGGTVVGEATVYLLPPAPEIAPIAVADSVVVRAGAQVDIPVLENDIAPSGGRPTLNPASVVSSSSKALAFASGDVLRYLAPDEPGDYGVDYTVYTTGSPALADTATVRVRVLGEEANRAPLPETLRGRVLSGGTTRIEFDGFGVDPDGDAVTLERIVSQPDRGAATVAADGSAIIYTSIAGDRGQVSFTYSVVDTSGEVGEGTARVGVLDAETNPSPVTYSDYVQVQAGQGATIRVSPLANDVDPTLGTLSLTRVVPDLAATFADGSPSPEYERLSSLIGKIDATGVVIGAGAEPSTMSFLYDVTSTSGNTARGLIVVKVVRERVPDYPVVADTTLTVETRDDFTSGVDVLDGKVSWSGGDVSSLALSLWGDPKGVSVTGASLSGELPTKARVIPFAVTGQGSDGEVTTYAFLRIPAEDQVSLALRADAQAQTVEELASVTFDMGDLVALPRGKKLEVGPDVSAAGARAAASCTLAGGTSVRYDAGEGAPWADTCRVPVRVEGQDDWTLLAVPITVQALDPQPELRPAALTVGPGETATFDLHSMTTWQLREGWDDIRYQVAYSGSAFSVTQSGTQVTVTGADDAVPGTEEAATVSATSHTDVVPARLSLRVGAAPSALPQGGSVTQQCSQASGTSCNISVIGSGSEVNPLPRTPLQLVSVRSTGACVGVSFSVASATSVTASWTGDAPGTTCTAAFSVRDAQGRQTNGDRDGRVLLDLQGYPKTPASVAQTGYGDGTLTLRIDPGGARAAYPALTGFVVRVGQSEVATCDADGRCPDISAPNGEQRTYEAFAVNDVGQSKAGVSTTAWAYDPPRAPARMTVTPVVTRDGEGNIVSLVIEGIDAGQTGEIEITSPAATTMRVPVGRDQSRIEISDYRVGSNHASLITVTPYSRYAIPPGLTGSTTGSAITKVGNGVGAPTNPSLQLSSAADGDGTVTIQAQGGAQSGGDGSTITYGIVLWRSGDSQPSCSADSSSPSASFAGLEDGLEYSATLCAESRVGGTVFGRTQTSAEVRAAQSGRAPTGWTFVVDGTPNVSGGRAEWVIRNQPTTTERIPNRNHAEISGGPPTSVFGRDPGITVQYVHDRWENARTPAALVAPAAGSAPYQVQASWQFGSCVGGSALRLREDSSGGAANIDFNIKAARYFDIDNNLLAVTAPGVVPIGAVRVDSIGVTVDWSAQGWNLKPATSTLGGVCDPNNPPPEPEPTPEPTPDPDPSDPATADGTTP